MIKKTLLRYIILIISLFSTYCKKEDDKIDFLIPCRNETYYTEEFSPIAKLKINNNSIGIIVSYWMDNSYNNNYSYAFKTLDGGANWENLQFNANIVQYLDIGLWTIDILNENHFSIYRGNSHDSSDGGLSWNTHTHDGTYFSGSYRPSYYKGQYFDSLNAYRAGRGVEYLSTGNTLRWPVFSVTTDGGQNWARKDPDMSLLGTNVALFDVQFLDQNIGWMIVSSYDDDTTQLIKTIDNGTNWNVLFEMVNTYNQPPDSDDNIFWIYFYNEQIGWIYGGNILRNTFDGGITWLESTPQFVVGANYIEDIKFIDVNNGYVFARNSELDRKYLYKTTDGGLNWNLLKEFPDEYDNFNVVDQNNMWLANDYEVYYSSDEFINSTVVFSYNFQFLSENTRTILGWPIWFCF